MSQAERDDRGVLDQFRWSIQALACPPDAQLALFPDFVRETDELALDYGHWFEVARSFFPGEFSENQLAALWAIDARLDAMSNGGAEFDEELWSEASLRTSPAWEELRDLAGVALAKLGWPAETPPKGRSLYVPGGPPPA